MRVILGALIGGVGVVVSDALFTGAVAFIVGAIVGAGMVVADRMGTRGRL